MTETNVEQVIVASASEDNSCYQDSQYPPPSSNQLLHTSPSQNPHSLRWKNAPSLSILPPVGPPTHRDPTLRPNIPPRPPLRSPFTLPRMSHIISPFLFFGLLVLGAVGVAWALPRKGPNPQVIGAAIAGLAGGLLMLALGIKAGPDKIPNIYFYIFSAVGLGGALRVITHPRPVYAALYFIMTVVASAGLFLILSAEFMAFALVIVYAGAILITYLFVIMLATQAPEEGQEDVLAEYDTQAREPVAATVIGFVLLAALTTMMFRGTTALSAPPKVETSALLKDMPRKVDRILRTNGVLADGAEVMANRTDWNNGQIHISSESGTEQVLDRSTRTLNDVLDDGSFRVVKENAWPEELTITNNEMLGFNLLRDHPGTIEIAGVILLMAMLGAVVLSRKQVQMDDDAKAARVTHLAKADPSHDLVAESPLELVQQASGASIEGDAR